MVYLVTSCILVICIHLLPAWLQHTVPVTVSDTMLRYLASHSGGGGLAPPISLGIPFHELRQRIIVWFFGMMVIGILWIWPLVLWLASTSPLLMAALAAYTGYVVWGPGARAAEHDTWPAPFSKLGMWEDMAAYFPARLIKTAELDPAGKYVFACFPHGISSIGVWLNLGTSATGRDHLFRGIKVHVVTLAANFRTPFLREWCLLNGLRSCSRAACINLLQSPSNALVLVPGGASEALVCRNGSYDLVLNRRKGFVRVALQTGASLVPVISFGEVELFSTIVPAPGSWGWKLQQLAHKLWSTSQPVFWGSGIFADPGLLPYRRPVSTVTGKPIPVPKVSADDPRFHDLVEQYHAAFKEALQQLFDEHAAELAPGTKMHIVA